MYAKLSGFALLVSIAGMLFGCISINDTQRNIAEDQLSAYDDGNGVIVGSVTAPFDSNYHETIIITYRSMGGGTQHDGVITSGTQHGNPLIDIPTCGESDIPQLCGRLFAVSLPAGNYEIYEVMFRGREVFRGLLPMKFAVRKGSMQYLGNLHVSFCSGMVSRNRGNIVGADVIIWDEYERDTALIRKRFGMARSAVIERQLLTDLNWRLRVSRKPFDWGDCRR